MKILYINEHVLKNFNDTQLECLKKQFDCQHKVADQNVIDDEVVGDFYDQYDAFEKVYNNRKRVQ